MYHLSGQRDIDRRAEPRDAHTGAVGVFEERGRRIPQSACCAATERGGVRRKAEREVKEVPPGNALRPGGGRR
jgi:hypothetical protein